MGKFQEAMNLINRGKLQEAKNLFEEILTDDPTNVDALYNLGMCFTDLGEPEKAILSLKQSIKYKPNHSNAHVALGFAYSRTGDSENAKRHSFDALKINPRNSFALRNLGGLFGRIGDLEKSLYYFEKAYEINSLDPNTLYGLGYAYEQIKDYEKADSYYEEVLKVDDPPNLRNLAKDGLRRIAVSHFKSKGFRMDAVFYLLDALKLFEQKVESEVRNIAFEIGLKGQGGLDINNPEKKYSLNTLEGEFTGLQLICYMYAGFKKIDSSLDVGVDLSDEYSMALKLFNSGDVF